jgi:hypothetical protein
MAAAMRDWIGPLVESELKAACTSFERKYFPGRRVEEGHGVCGPDAVTVRVKKRGEVQIIEVSNPFPRIFSLLRFQQFSGPGVHPFEATVSDGTTCVRATFDRDVTNLFTKMNGRDFLDIRGGVIALLDYNIVSSHLCLCPWNELT